MTFIAPHPELKSFTCPHCGVYARQNKWGHRVDTPAQPKNEQQLEHAALIVARCENCEKNCFWFHEQLIYPSRGNAPPPNTDMPQDVRQDYEEAARIYFASPRGAAALLRLSIQKLMIHLGRPGRSINDDIAALVASGLPAQVQQALDVVRVTGNNAVHPGQIDANDASVAEQLFPLVNVIVEYQISLPARVSEMYAALPESARGAIVKRDARS